MSVKDRLVPVHEVVDEAMRMVDDFQSGRIKPLFPASKAERELIRGYYPGDIITLAGMTGDGKTARLIKILLELCNPKYNPTMYNKIQIDFDTWEMSSVDVILRVVAAMLYLPVKELLDEKTLTANHRQVMAEVTRKIKSLPISFNQIPQDIERYKDNKYARCEWGVENHKQMIFAMDHLRMTKWFDEKTEERKLSSFMEAQVVIEKDPARPIFFNLSQVGRSYQQRVAEFPAAAKIPPGSHELFGASSIEQCSKLICIYHRPGKHGLATWKTAKGEISTMNGDRDNLWIESWPKQRSGGTGIIAMRHEIEYLKFTDI